MSGDKVGLLCHIGGELVREEVKVYFKGGAVRLIYVDRTIDHQELLKKVGALSKQPLPTPVIKYKHPDIDFDSPFVSPLVTIEDEDDLRNMMEAYSGPKPNIPFYMSTRETSSRTTPVASRTPAQAVTNNVTPQATPFRLETSPRTSARANKKSTTAGPRNQCNGSVLSAKADARKRKKVTRASKALAIDKRVDHDSDSSVATGNESGREELYSTPSGSSREPNSNRSSSRRVTRSMRKGADAGAIEELVDNPSGSKELFPLQESFDNLVEQDQSPREGSLLKKGLEFESVDAFKRALTEASLLEKFGYKPVRTSSSCISVKCVSEGCKWRLRAIKQPGVAIFKIKKLNSVHTCGGNGVTQNHPNARIHWIANFILDRLRENLDYKPRDIIEDIHRQYGVKVSYHKAYRGRKEAFDKIHGSYEESIKALPAFFREVERTNPKSVLFLQCDAENCFQRLFIALYASIHGFLLGCRPLLAFKGINIQGKYPSVLLIATAVDANGEGFPLAYAIAESENIDSWGWFLSWLRQALERELGNSLRSVPWLTVISEEQEGLIQGVKVSFPGAYHGLCVSRITRRIARLYNDETVKDYIWAAARAYTRADFDNCMREVRKMNIRAHDWIMANLNPKDWATAYFEGQRFSILASDIGESFTSWISETRDMPILSLVQELHTRLMSHFSRQRELGIQMQSVLVPNAEARLLEKSKEALGFRVQHGSATEHEVFDTKGSNFLVNLSQNTCTCFEWQVEGLPCAHAVAVIQLERLDVYRFCQPWFMTARFQMSYSEEMHPIPDRSEWNYEDIITVKAPLTKSRRGRPKSFGNEKEVCESHRQCSACKQIGHNKRTCSRHQIVASSPAES